MADLIPGLIWDLGRDCLFRVSYQDLPTAAAVCRSWQSEIQSPELLQWRKVAGVAQNVVVLAQADSGPDLNPGPGKHPSKPSYRVTIFDPVSGSWKRVSSIPGLEYGLPMFCGLVGVGSDLVVLGGWDPNTWRVSKEVYIYSFPSAMWRRGANMPGVARSFFGCASDSDGMVLVAGGHDEGKNALRSVMLYDVTRDEWKCVPDMAKERDECKVVFHRGKFHAISGYPTYAQGCFESSAEVFDLDMWTWDPVSEEFLDSSVRAQSCLAAEDGRFYAFMGRRGGKVAMQHDDAWKVVAEVPTDARSSQFVVTWWDKLLMIGATSFGQPHNAYMLDLGSYRWSKVDVPKEYCGHVGAGCVLEL